MKTYKITLVEHLVPEEGNDNKYGTDRTIISADVDTIKQIKDLVEALHE